MFPRLFGCICVLFCFTRGAAAQPENDACASAIPVSAGTTTFDILGATTDGSLVGCPTGTMDVWFAYTPPAYGAIEIDAGASNLPATLAAFTACGGAELTCANNVMTINVAPDTTHLIRFSRRAGSGTNGSITIRFRLPAPNDGCAGAIPVGPGPAQFDAASATPDAVGLSCIAPGPDVWFRFTPPASGRVFVLFSGSSSLSVGLGAFGSCGGSQIACAVNNMSFQAVGGTPYLVSVRGSYGALSGQISFGLDASSSYTIETRWVAASTTAAQGARGTQLAPGTVVDDATPTLISGGAPPGPAYAQRFDLQARVLDAPGQPERGLLAVRGGIATTNGAGVRVAALHNPASAGGFAGLGDRSPFGFGPATEVYRMGTMPSVAPQVNEIFNVSADLSAYVVSNWTYNFETGQENPMPGAPPLVGVAPQWANVYRVLVQAAAPGLTDTGVVRVEFAPADCRAVDGYGMNPVSPPTEDRPVESVTYFALQVSGNGGGNVAAFRLRFPVPCLADFNGVDGLTLQDVYDYFAAWNLHDPRCDVDGEDGVTVQDFFNFLLVWVGGCP